MITQKGAETMAKLIKDNILEARSIVGGKYVKAEIQKIETVQNKVKIYTYLNETISGTISKHEVLTKDGYVFLEKTDNVVKDNTRGMLTVFEITTKEG